MLGLEGIPPGSAQVAGGYSAHFLLSSVYLCDRLNSLTATQISCVLTTLAKRRLHCLARCALELRRELGSKTVSPLRFQSVHSFMHATKRPQLLTPQDDHQGAIPASDVWIDLP